MTLDRHALVLNQNFEPLNVCSARRAFLLVHRGKAEILEAAEGGIRGVGVVFQLPSVIRLERQVRRPRPRVRLTRREVFARDRGRCQYCGRRGGELTLDHVVPRHRGGRHEWSNLVTACRQCNHRKAGRSPSEAGMDLLRKPSRPEATVASIFGQHLHRYGEWQPFVIGWLDRATREQFAAS